MAATPKFLSDEQWAKIGPLLPSKKPGPKGGRPPAPNREVLEGILWILRTGARWQDLPKRYPSPSTCWRRLKRWAEQDLWLKIWRTCLSQLDGAGLLDWRKPLLTPASRRRKRGLRSRENQAGKGLEVDGGGRRPGYSSGRRHYLGIARGSKAGRRYLGDHQSPPPGSRPPQNQTQAPCW